MKALIIDDEEHCCEVLEALLKKHCNDIQVSGFCNNGMRAIEWLQHNNVDLVFLDIEMPAMNGFEFLEQCPVRNFEIIFTTAYNEYAIQAIRHSALDYLLKPVDKTELLQAVQRAKEQKAQLVPQRIHHLLEMLGGRQKTNRLALPTGDGLLMVNTSDILYCKSDGPYCTFYFTNSKPLLISKTLKEAEDALDATAFCRIHHSYLINMQYVQKYIRGEGGEVVLINGTNLPVSRTRKQEFLQLLERM